MYKFIDLFAGIGGFRVALQKQGLKCVFSSEIDKEAKRAYERNFNDEVRGDICEIQEKEIPKHDILCAGFPCQSFSISGKHGGLRDNRGRLFYEVVRIAEYHKPCVLLLENVRNIITIDGGQVIKTIENKLDEIGYKVHYSVMDASDYGIPQRRQRVYFACLRKDMRLDFHTPKPTKKSIYLRNILDKSVDERLIIERDDIVIQNKEEPECQRAPIRVGYLNKGGQGERIYHPNGHAITLSANGGGVGARTGLYLVNGDVRRLSISECKRLMGFDKRHIVSSGIQGYQQLGNAVIPDMVSRTYNGLIVICMDFAFINIYVVQYHISNIRFLVAIDWFGYDFALAFHHSDHHCLVCSSAPLTDILGFFVSRLAPDVGFIYFNNARQYRRPHSQQPFAYPLR